MSMLEAVYVECKEEKSIVAIKPKPAFRPIFEIAETKARSGITLTKDEYNEKASSVVDDATENGMCSWWRRGREPVSEVGLVVGHRRGNMKVRSDMEYSHASSSHEPRPGLVITSHAR